MAREIVVELNGKPSRFDFSKVDRKKLYGSRRRVPLDPSGAQCTKAELTADGALLIQQGMTAQGYFDDTGLWYPNAEMQSLHPDGTVAEKVDSTLGVPQALEKVAPSVLFDARVEAVYALSPAELDADLQIELESGTIYQFPFNYRAGYAPAVAFLIANDTGFYALVGRSTEPEWVSLEAVQTDDFSDDDGLDDDLDFEMF